AASTRTASPGPCAASSLMGCAPAKGRGG
ncbi:MAG: hypothetical protein AVDCRST_MAG88-4686, partial [uncultured Thermomicrobiales bacterium]